MKACKEEFKKWLDAHSGRYTVPALRMGFEGGFRTALEWMLTQKVRSTEEMLIDEDAIREELEEE